MAEEKEINGECTAEVKPHEKNDSSDQKSDADNPATEGAVEENEWLDILGSGQLKKKVIKAGENDSRPERYHVCVVNIQGTLEDGTVVEKYENYRFQLGDAEVIQGLDLAIPLMDVGEEADILVGPRFGYGTIGRPPDIPPNAEITYRVQLLSSESETPLENLSALERKRIGNMKRERGNWWYSRDEHNFAIQCYRRALDFLDDIEGGILVEPDQDGKKPNEDELQDLLEDRLKVYNNLAAAQLKIKAYDSALSSVQTVLRCQPKNVKALFRKGKILAARGDTEAAIPVLRLASQLEPESKVIHQELSQLVKQKKKDSEMEKNLYRRMLGQDKVDENSKIDSRSKYSKISWGLVLGSLATMCVGIAAYKFKLV
ncbi:peptidyl-prolyl cis-trans isomerase FKBP8 [Ischnura elegans]|uniref:peptidyl-prolyl cis-trans isomerase FKBP8 n=1 Tax=Ischnura elegans TaxID=197161 RepID=UPI001ED88D98|nr:peptidyl-prolyl cis-trans isomerase FKBP8 [Ischnura elegans]